MGATDDLLKQLKKKGTPAPRTPGTSARGGGSATADLLAQLTGGKKGGPVGGEAAKADNTLGGILRQVDQTVGGVAKGLGSLVVELGKSQMNQKYNQDAAPEAERLPLLTEVLVRSPVKTAKSLGTPAELARGVPWAETALGKRVATEGVVGTALSSAADLSIFAGGVGALGKAAGAGRLAKAARLEEVAGASTKAAGLKRTATIPQIEEAVRVAQAAGNAKRVTSLERAAAQLREAQTLRAAPSPSRIAGVPVSRRVALGAERATAGAKTFKSFGAHVAASPAKPYALVGRHLLKLKGPLSGTAAGAAVKGFVADQRTKKQFRDLSHAEVTAPLSQYAYDLVEGKHKWGESMKELDLDHQAAVTLRHAQVGDNSAFKRFWDDDLDEGGRYELIGKAYPEVDAVNAMNIMRQWDEGTLDPKTTGRLNTAADRMRNFYAEREAKVFLPGRGENLSERALEARRQNVEGVPSDLSVGMLAEKRSLGTKIRLARTEAEAAALRSAAPEAAPKTIAQQRRLATDAERVRRFRDEVRRTVPGAQGRLARAQAEAAERANRIEAGNVSRGIADQERRLKTLATRRDRDLAKLDEIHEKAKTDIRTAPAQDRPALILNAAAADYARNLAKTNPEHAHHYLTLAEEMAVTSQAYRAGGAKPQFSFGGKDVESRSPVVGSGPAIRSRRKITRQRLEGRLRLSMAGQADRATREMGDILINELPAKVQERMGTTVKALDGPAIRGTGPQIAKALEARGQGFYAWDVKTGKRLADEDVTTSSAVIPSTLFDSFQSYVAKPNEKSLSFKAGRVYDQVTGTWKVTVLALSPSWHVGNLKGNAIMLTIGGGPRAILELPEALRQVRKGEAPVEILASGFRASLDDMAPGAGGGTVRRAGRRVVKGSFAMNSFVDNVGRTAVYLSERKKGVSHEAGISAALRAMGDFGRMTPKERRIVRRLAPFWAWQKHITILTFRLPIENPARVAWTLHLAESADRAIDDPGKDNEFNADTLPGPGGTRIPLFGVDPFSSSIPASIMSGGVQSVPRAIGYSLNPIIKTGIAAVGGVDPNKGIKAVTTPETGGAYGEPYPLVPITPTRARRLAEYAAQSVPQVKKIQDAIEGESQARMSTGQPTRGTERGRLAQLFRSLGVPFPEPEQKSKKRRR